MPSLSLKSRLTFSGNITSSVSVSVPKLASVSFRVPEHPQLAFQAPYVPNAVRSQPRWPQNHFSRLVSACMCQQARHPTPVFFYTPFPCIVSFVSQRGEPRSTKPSDKPVTIRHQVITAWWLFHPPKPLDSHLNAYDTLHARTPPTIFGHTPKTGDSHFFSWGESQVPGILHRISTLAPDLQLTICFVYMPLTFGQTPVYSPLATNVHSQPYRSTCRLWQPLERITTPLTHHRSVHNPPFNSVEKCTVAVAQDIGEPKLTYSDHGLHTITTAPQSHTLPWQDQSQFMPQGVSSREKEPQRHHMQPRRPTFTRSGIHQVTLSAGQFATTPPSHGCPHFAGGLSPMSHVGGSVYMLCRNVHGGMRHDFVGSTSAQIGAQAQGFGDSTMHM